jgi:hypothetical protein
MICTKPLPKGKKASNTKVKKKKNLNKFQLSIVIASYFISKKNANIKASNCRQVKTMKS